MYVILFVLRLFLQKKKKNSKRRFLIIPASKKQHSAVKRKLSFAPKNMSHEGLQ